MTKPWYWRRPLALYLYEFAMNHLAIDNYRFEVAELILEFSLRIFTSKEVNTILNRVAL